MNKKILLVILLCFCISCVEVQASGNVVTQSLTVGDEIPEIKENITHSITQPDVQPTNNVIVQPVVETVYYPQVYSPPTYRRQVTRYEYYPNGGVYYGGYGYSGRGMTVYTNPFGGYNFGGESHYYGPNLNYRPPLPPNGGFHPAPPPPPPNHKPPSHRPNGKPHGGFKGGIMF